MYLQKGCIDSELCFLDIRNVKKNIFPQIFKL